jgi:mannose-1-phosphate guanylyltransferase
MLAGVPFIAQPEVSGDTLRGRVWTIVLTGDSEPGPARAHRPRRHHGGRWPHRPATVMASRARRMLERAGQLAPPGQMLAVMTRRRAAAWEQVLASLPQGPRLVQPDHRGGAAELLLALLKIARRDPVAIVIVLPAGHRLEHDVRFTRHVSRALWAVGARPDLPLLIGAPPEAPPADGWIEPGAAVEGLEAVAVRTVRRFVDGASPAERRRLFDDHALVSTSILVARVDTLLAVAGRALPEVLETLEPLHGVLDRPEEALLCQALYEHMPQVGLRRLERAPEVAVLVLPDVVWRQPELARLERLAA